MVHIQYWIERAHALDDEFTVHILRRGFVHCMNVLSCMERVHVCIGEEG